MSKTRYDFHGQCDLVMVDAPDFNDGEGLLVHIRKCNAHSFYSLFSCLMLANGT